MEFKILINNEEINVLFIKNRRLKNSYMKILDDKNIRIKGNLFFTQNDAKEFIYSKSAWIQKHITKLKNKKLFENEFFYMGEKYTFETFNEKIENIDDFYREKSQESIPKIVEEFSHKMQLYPKSIKFRKNKSRWGSCSFSNNINLNIYLMKLPLEVIKYVVVHELAHIKHKNHSKNFWDLVSLHMPHYKSCEKMIKCY